MRIRKVILEIKVLSFVSEKKKAKHFIIILKVKCHPTSWKICLLLSIYDTGN